MPLLPYHLANKHGAAQCEATFGIVHSLAWWRDLKDTHGYKTVVKNRVCKACRVVLDRESIFKGTSTAPVGNEK